MYWKRFRKFIFDWFTLTNFDTEHGSCWGGACCPGAGYFIISSPESLNPFSDVSDYICCFNYDSSIHFNLHKVIWKQCIVKLLDLKYQNEVEMTPCYCVAYCSQKNYSLAGISRGRWVFYIIIMWQHFDPSDCFCNDKLSTNVTETECGTICPGDPAFKCGSPGYLSVYGTGL